MFSECGVPIWKLKVCQKVIDELTNSVKEWSADCVFIVLSQYCVSGGGGGDD